MKQCRKKKAIGEYENLLAVLSRLQKAVEREMNYYAENY